MIMTSSLLSSQHFNSTGGCFQQCLGHGSSVSAAANNKKSAQSEIMKSTEDILASEMTKLSVEERSKALDDLHCVGEGLKETPEMIESLLAEFDRVLQERKAPIYDLAASQNRSYVEDPAFRLRFLRANHHNVNPAVNQMIGFLSHKETYFGRDTIARDITLEDFDEEDIALLFSGVYHIQDGRDRSGRVVVFFFNHMFNRCTVKSLIRVNYFIFVNILSPMPSVQTKGIVLCYYDFSTPDKSMELFQFDDILKFMDFTTKVPLRRSALHACIKPGRGTLLASNSVFERSVKLFRPATKSRFRLHYGSDIELQYTLQSYGFNMETFPVDTGGNPRWNILNIWFDKYVDQRNRDVAKSAVRGRDPQEVMLERNCRTEAHKNNSMNSCVDAESHELAEGHGGVTSLPSSVNSWIIEPTLNDVLMGKGPGIQNHPGNIQFREFVKSFQEEYNNTPRYKRLSTPTELTDAFLEMGIRFLKKTESGVWVESEFAEVEKKVKQLFRSQKKSMKKLGGTI